MKHQELKRLWDEHVARQFPEELYTEPGGIDVVELDAAIAGCVSSALTGAITAQRRALLLDWATILKATKPLLNSHDAVAYCDRLIELVEVAIAPDG